jgi:hypothetical protein
MFPPASSADTRQFQPTGRTRIKRGRTFAHTLAFHDSRVPYLDLEGVLMARPIWNGAISFGLLNVPVRLYSAERSVDLGRGGN